jgi:hypothetical protein
MRRPLAALALAVTLTLGALPASSAFAAGDGMGGRGGILEMWEVLRAGWLGFWSERVPGVDPNGRESVTSEYGGGVDPYGRCSGSDCPPPPAAQATTDDPDR